MAHSEENLIECAQETDVGGPAYGGVFTPESNHFTTPVGLMDAGFDAKQVYFSLMQDEGPDELALVRSRHYLAKQLRNVASYRTDLPEQVAGLQAWSDANTRSVGTQYRHYLDTRKAGGDRLYFMNKAHALYFLKRVAPTKLVDGSWLYGLLSRWQEPRFLPLIQTYLEELGEGLPDKNHVVLYKKLLALHGCQQWSVLGDDYFVQGAIQLSLAEHAAHFLPEVIGYNLGYEQLPLHLLITAYELNELGIDPYYFTLHVTVDNAATGHATQAIQGLRDALPSGADRDVFYRRVINGYKLNMPGASTNSVISEFDLDAEFLEVLTAKAKVGAQLHSDYCRVGGKLVSEWLSEPARLPLFVQALQKNGWIRRHENPVHSRFWGLIQGEQAQMFGVFNAYEKQVIHDWIAGDCVDDPELKPRGFCAAQRLGSSAMAAAGDPGVHVDTHNDAIPDGAETSETPGSSSDFDADLQLLKSKLAGLQGQDAQMALLARFMSPVQHHTRAGLWATRLFSRMLYEH